MKTAYVCDNCGYDSVKWYGKCPACGSWDTLKEIRVEPDAVTMGASGQVSPADRPEALDRLSTEDALRFHTGYGELDRVLGGGAVKGSLVLIGGEPGIGDSLCPLSCSNLGIEAKRPNVYGCFGFSKISSILASSITRPPYMTMTRVHSSATTPKS